MLLTMLMFARHSVVTAAPAPSAVTVTSTEAGNCVGSTTITPRQPAALRVSWTIANADTTLYETKLYESDILVATLTNDETQWDKEISGNIEDGTYSSWTSTWIYRVDVVRKADAAVVASATSAVWSQPYGACEPA